MMTKGRAMPAGEPPQLSVVIPCRNVAHTLGVQLDALARQEAQFAWEVIVVDNASSDGTADVARAYADRLRLRVVGCPTPGINAARNAGVEAAQADLIALCDGDDEVADGWVSAIHDVLENHDYVTGPLELDKLNAAGLAASRGRAGATGIPTFGKAFGFARGGNMGVRRETLRRVGGFNETTACLDDHELGLRMHLAGVPVAYAPEALVRYRYRSDAKGLWCQGLVYGSGRVAVYRAAKSAGLQVPGPFAGWRSWAWLVVHLPSLGTRDGRLAWISVLGNRVGHVVGSARWRTIFI